MSHSLLGETYCFADGRCLFKQSWRVICPWDQYTNEEIKKMYVHSSVCRQFVTLTNMPTPPLLTVE